MVNEMFKEFTDREDEASSEKDFLEIKYICSLHRLFEFFYVLHQQKELFTQTGFEILNQNLRTFSISVSEKAKDYVYLYPEIGLMLIEILQFFMA